MSLRTLDRPLTGLALFIATAVSLLLFGVFLVEVGRHRHFDRMTHVQGNYLTWPADRPEDVRGSVVNLDGTLDPAANLRPSEARGALFFSGLGQVRWPAVAEGYRYNAGHSFGWGTVDGWKLSFDGCIVRTGARGEMAGSLTDEGWIPGRRAAGSFKDAEWWALPRTDPRAMEGRILVYVARNAVYVADLEKASIRKVIPHLSAGRYLPLYAWEGSDTIYVLTETSIHRIRLADPVDVGTFERPLSFRGIGPCEGALATEGRLILRSEVPKSRTETSVRYRVAVLDPKGTVEREYEYALSVAAPGQLHSIEDPGSSARAENVKRALPGWLTSKLMPAAGWPTLPLLRPLSPRYYPDLRTFFVTFFDPWAAGLLGTALAALAARRERRRSAGWMGPAAWFAFVVAFGIPAALTWWLLGRKERFETCASCGRVHTSGFAACPACRTRAAEPGRLGIEILKPA